MRTTWIIGVWAAVLLASCGLPAQETFSTKPGETATRSSANAETGHPVDGWRYKFHNGHWWYYLRSSQWSYWNGTAWTPYDQRTYGQWYNRQLRSDGLATNEARREAFMPTDRRTPGTIQRQKNDSRREDFGALGRRYPGIIQRQKNDSRSGDFGPALIRPPGTIQREKNNARGDED